MSVLSPYTFQNGLRVKNRVVLAALTNLQSHADGTLSDAELAWLELRARGGFGIVTTCAAYVSSDGKGWAGELGIHDDAMLPGLTRLARVLRSHGAASLVQLFHGGFRADARVSGEMPWSASGPATGAPDHREATAADVSRVITQFADAAARAEAAGMDGVEIHGAHGYVLTQFLSRVDNRRTDGYGGELVGRARLVREVVRAVRARVKPGFVVGVRLSPEDFGNARGLDLDESLVLSRWLSDDGIDFLHLSLWNAFRSSTKRPDSHPIGEFRAALPPKVALLVAGKVWTREEADSLLGLGADAVALGRAAIANPDWSERAGEGGWEPRRPPLSPDELAERALSPVFVGYMRQWRGFVTEDAAAVAG